MLLTLPQIEKGFTVLPLCSGSQGQSCMKSNSELEFSGFGSTVVLVTLVLLLQLGPSVPLEGCSAAGSHSWQCDKLWVCNSIGLMLKNLCPSDVPKQPITPSRMPNTSLFC